MNSGGMIRILLSLTMLALAGCYTHRFVDVKLNEPRTATPGSTMVQWQVDNYNLVLPNSTIKKLVYLGSDGDSFSIGLEQDASAVIVTNKPDRLDMRYPKNFPQDVAIQDVQVRVENADVHGITFALTRAPEGFSLPK